MKSHKYDRIFSELFGTPWLISEEWMMTIVEIAKRQVDFDAVAARKGKYMENTERAKMYGNKAVIPISGPIFPKSNLMTDFSGATSIEILSRDLLKAVNDDGIESIILDIDSPGGHVTGINEMANMIREYSVSKKITAYVSGTGTSAAYWLASACSEIVVDATSRVGSIGVVVAYPKESGDVIEIVNTTSPNKRPDITTDDGRAVVVGQMDALAEVFISSVANFRNTTEKKVLSDFGRGGILVGEHAVKVGMADRLGSFEQLLKENGGNSMSGKGTEATLTLVTLKADHPDVYKAAFTEGSETAKTEASQIIAEKDSTITQLESTVATMKEENAGLTNRVGALEKKDALRDELTAQNNAEAIVAAQLSASSLPIRMHTKVKKQISADDFIADGQLDKDKFTAHVDAEISDWEDTLAGSTSTVQGFGTAPSKEESNTKVDDDAADELVKLAGGM